MTDTHTVWGWIGQGTALETCVSDEDLERSIDTEPPAVNEHECNSEQPYSDEIMEAFRRAKSAGVQHDMRSRRILRRQWEKREGSMDGAPELVGQTAIFDFRK